MEDTQYSKHEERLNSVERRLERIDGTLEHITSGIEQIANIVNQPSTIPWNPILSALALVAMLIAGYATIITQPLAENLSELQVDQRDEHKLLREQDREIMYKLGYLEGIISEMEEEK